MAYINTQTNQYPITESEIRAENPNTSFAIPFQAPEPYAPVLNSPTPVVPNPVLQFAREITPKQDELGNWMQQFEIVDIYSDYTDVEGVLHTKAEQEAAAIAKDEDAKKAANKAQAESLLKETDWVEVPSVSDVNRIPHLANYEEFMSYRMALRTIAVTPSVTVTEWPVLPTENWITA